MPEIDELIEGKLYTRDEVRNFVRRENKFEDWLGQAQGFSLSKKKLVLALFLGPKDPEAPNVVLIGKGAKVAPTGAQIAKQTAPIHMFTKVREAATGEKGHPRNLKYKGRYVAIKSSDSPARIKEFDLGDRRENDISLAISMNRAEVSITAVERESEEPDLDGLPIGGQGRGLTPEQRTAVEMHAMGSAKKWLLAHDYTVKNVSKDKRASCDFHAKLKGQSFVVEVKGTTGSLGSILLTRKEVELHRAEHPNNILLVVHDIKLSGVKPSGGKLSARKPWLINDAQLKPVCFEYRIIPRS